MVKALGYAATHSYSRLKRLEFEREEASTNEIEIEVLYCGVCHSDIHQMKNEWSNTASTCQPPGSPSSRAARPPIEAIDGSAAMAHDLCRHAGSTRVRRRDDDIHRFEFSDLR